MNRYVIFSHYDVDGIIDEYVIYYLKQLHKIAYEVIVISTAPLRPNEADKLKDLATVIVRENIGYDFYSWKLGLQQIDFNTIDELVICNDSVYGPLYPLEEMFDKMAQNYDFWGITDTCELGYHLQSYFVVFIKPVISSSVFTEFWTNIQPLNGKMKIVKNYELKMTETFLNAGFKCGVVDTSQPPKLNISSHITKPSFVYKFLRSLIPKYIYHKPVRYYGNNPTLYFGDHLIKSGVPVVKVALLRDNPRKVDISGIKGLIEKYTEYDYSLIENHLARVKRTVCS